MTVRHSYLGVQYRVRLQRKVPILSQLLPEIVAKHEASKSQFITSMLAHAQVAYSHNGVVSIDSTIRQDSKSD